MKRVPPCSGLILEEHGEKMPDKQDNGRKNKYFDILGLSRDAKPEEIFEAYVTLKEEQSAQPPEENRDRPFVLGEIEEAYHALTEDPGEVGSEDKDKTDEKNTEDESIFFTGPALREIRKKLNIEFEDITQETKITHRMLKAIENENFDALPPEVYVRGFLKSYAAFLSLDAGDVMKDYMSRYGKWKTGADKNRMHFRLSRKKGAFSIQAKK